MHKLSLLNSCQVSIRITSQGPKGWAELSGKEQLGSKPRMKLLWKQQTQQTGSALRHKGGYQAKRGAQEGRGDATSLPHEFHQEGVAKMKLWASQ